MIVWLCLKRFCGRHVALVNQPPRLLISLRPNTLDSPFSS